jgi:hypothetical protein
VIDVDAFKRDGWARVPHVVDKDKCAAVVDAIFESLGVNRDDPQDWYRPPVHPGGWVEMYQHQALWDVRQDPAVHDLFAAIYGTDDLWVSLDRASFKPPSHPDHPDYDHKGFIHWDLDTSKLPVPFTAQGVLYLTETTEDQGGFQCVPDLFGQLDDWVASQPPDRNPYRPDIAGFDVVHVAGEAGDLIVWDRRMPHGNGHNVSDRPRLAQYVTMRPPQRDDPAALDKRLSAWRDGHNGAVADLTPLGERLLGLTST